MSTGAHTMRKDPAVVRKALFVNQHTNANGASQNDSGFYDSQHSLKSNNNAPKIGTFLIVIIIAAVTVKNAHLITGKPISDLFHEANDLFLSTSSVSSEWLQNNYGTLSGPLMCAMFIAFFTWMMVFLDSDVPGLNPPIPFSPQKIYRSSYLLHREKSCNLGLLVSVASGIAVFLLLLLIK